MHKVTKLARDGSGFECKPGLLALLQECLVVGLVKWLVVGRSHFETLFSGQAQAIATRPHLGLKRGGCLDHAEGWTS